MIDGWWMDVCISPSPSPAVVCSSESMTAFNSSAFNLRTPQKGGGGAWALYGVLQLPNRLACSDDTSSAPNICRQSCKSMYTCTRVRAHTHAHLYIYIYICIFIFFNLCVSASTSIDLSPLCVPGLYHIDFLSHAHEECWLDASSFFYEEKRTGLSHLFTSFILMSSS